MLGFPTYRKMYASRCVFQERPSEKKAGRRAHVLTLPWPLPSADVSLGNCSYLNTCRNIRNCKWVAVEGVRLAKGSDVVYKSVVELSLGGFSAHASGIQCPWRDLLKAEGPSDTVLITGMCTTRWTTRPKQGQAAWQWPHRAGRRRVRASRSCLCPSESGLVCVSGGQGICRLVRDKFSRLLHLVEQRFGVLGLTPPSVPSPSSH